ncbi:MAG: diacylglycerol kinase [Gammaproteobacteria bacterium]|nr:diacylglycerol kinase [Gammaproteobacteria bacterium]
MGPLASIKPTSRTEHAPVLHIVLNAASGSADADESRRAIEEILTASGRRFELLPVQDPKHLEAMAQRAVEAAVHDQGAIVAAGGDGTINAVARAALPTGRPFGIIPQGTFNYSSRAHGIPLEAAAATRALLTARIKPIQAGMVNDRIFLVNASLGMYPELLEDRERYKQRFGRRRIVAIYSGLLTLLRTHRQLALDIECDQEHELVRTPTLFVGNNPLQLEQFGLPGAEDVQRRRLAAVIVKPVSNMTMLWLAVRGALGQLGEEARIRHFAFRRMVVRAPPGHRSRQIKVATDGEICRMPLPLEFKVAAQPLLLMVPDESDT